MDLMSTAHLSSILRGEGSFSLASSHCDAHRHNALNFPSFQLASAGLSLSSMLVAL